MDRHYVKEMWTLALPVVPIYVFHQPWLKGYRGELGGGAEEYVEFLPYTWVDQELKKEMGH